MTKNLIVIISKVPERLSKYVSTLQTLNSNFLFFSDLKPFEEDKLHINLRLIVVDSVDGCHDVIDELTKIRAFEPFGRVPILLICKEQGCEVGIEALSAGASDYLSFSAVDKELAIRARMHINLYDKNHTSFESEIDLAGIYPLENMVILRKSLWYIHNNISSIKKIDALIPYVGRSAADINSAFKEHFGKTTFQYVRELKIKKAKTMLFKTRFPVTHIAEELGYSSPANFATAFKSVVGLSPNEFRKSSSVI